MSSSVLKMEVESFAKRKVRFNANTRRYVKEESNLQVCFGLLEVERLTLVQCVCVIFHLCFYSVVFRLVLIYFIVCILSG
jgi:hypothetical protein